MGFKSGGLDGQWSAWSQPSFIGTSFMLPAQDGIFVERNYIHPKYDEHQKV